MSARKSDFTRSYFEGITVFFRAWRRVSRIRLTLEDSSRILGCPRTLGRNKPADCDLARGWQVYLYKEPKPRSASLCSKYSIPIFETSIIYTMYFLSLSLVCGCDHVGEPIVRPELYNAGKIVEPDAGYIHLDCDQSAQLPDTLAIYCFENHDRGQDVVVDSAGNHDAKIVSTKTRSVRGPTCCGMARGFSETNSSSYIEIPDSPDWDLDEGSISFWLRISACLADGQIRGLISRASADREEAGHLGLVLLGECNWAAFISGEDEKIEVRANQPLTPGKWSHINLNFGPPDFELYLDGKLIAVRKGLVGTNGNGNPWVIGADTREATPGTVSPPTHFLTGAAVDLLRISSARNQLIF